MVNFHLSSGRCGAAAPDSPTQRAPGDFGSAYNFITHPGKTLGLLLGEGNNCNSFSRSFKPLWCGLILLHALSVQRAVMSKLSVPSCACAANLGNRRRLAGLASVTLNRHTARKGFSKFAETRRTTSSRSSLLGTPEEISDWQCCLPC